MNIETLRKVATSTRVYQRELDGQFAVLTRETEAGTEVWEYWPAAKQGPESLTLKGIDPVTTKPCSCGAEVEKGKSRYTGGEMLLCPKGCRMVHYQDPALNRIAWNG